MDKFLTRRLLLREYRIEDRADFIELFTDERVMKHVDEGVFSKNKASKLWTKTLTGTRVSNRFAWAVTERETGAFIGSASIVSMQVDPENWEIGFVLRESEWGKGYGTELAKELIDIAFKKLGFKAVYATVDDDHFASRNVLEKVGMNFSRHEYDGKGRYSVFEIRF